MLLSELLLGVQAPIYVQDHAHAAAAIVVVVAVVECACMWRID